jgi:hypothetical protein
MLSSCTFDRHLLAMPRITISYRRDDSLDITGRIFDRLAGHFGREAVFRDIDSIPPGADFRRHIDRVLDESDIILAIVGPRSTGDSPRCSGPPEWRIILRYKRVGPGEPRKKNRAAPARVAGAVCVEFQDPHA